MRWQRPNSETISVVLVFAAYYLAAGILVPYMPLWLSDRQLSTSEISIILGGPLLVRTLAAPLFGYLGDRYGQRIIIQIMTMLALAAALALPFVTGFWPLLLLAGIVYTSWQSTPLQLDAIAIGLIRRKAISSYGRIRVFGSTAFIIANLAGGLVLANFASDGVLIAFIVVAAMLLILTLRLPSRGIEQAGGRGASGPAVWHRPTVLLVILAAALIQSAHSSFMSYGALHMRSLGYAEGLIGFILGTATFAEVMMFAFSPYVVKRLRPVALITIGGTVALLRWILVGFVVDPEMFFVLQALHALTFGGTYLGLIGFIMESVEENQVARTQGIYVSVFGACNAGLTLAIGSLYDLAAGRAFLVSAGFAGLALLLLGARQFLIRRRPPIS